jgi:high-affinity iron transporter
MLPEHSALGMLLHTLIGYDSHPAGMQLVFYVAALIAIGTGMILAGGNKRQHKSAKAA